MKSISLLILTIAGLLVGTSSLQAQALTGYTLNPGDQLHISVWREDTLDKEVTVLPDGHITFPLIGSVNVVGVSSVELEKIIEDKLSDTIPGAEVTVLVLSVTGNRVYVIGKVLKPGEFIMSSEMTVAQVLSLAGGLDRFADGGGIKVQRIENGKVKYFQYNYDDLLSGKTIDSMSFILKAGDVVIVP
ncbi:MAG: polysaccharide biosynthesis/export family protein [Kordiimonadaceae bacterium]|nr:polysaccharide biosynthesis/export family protein [Kordiimonadaceae bacterium]